GPGYAETQLFSRLARRLQRKRRGSDVGKAKTCGHHRKRNQERYETGTIDLKKKHRDPQADSEQNHSARAYSITEPPAAEASEGIGQTRNGNHDPHRFQTQPDVIRD